MSTQHARQVSRRTFLSGVTLAGTAGLLGLPHRLVAAEPPPETTTLRLDQRRSICIAAQYVAEELLRGERFNNVQYIKKVGPKDIEPALASGEINIALHFAAPNIIPWRRGIPS
jgi:NitT/TauT family transport system substrate-binding protein